MTAAVRYPMFSAILGWQYGNRVQIWLEKDITLCSSDIFEPPLMSAFISTLVQRGELWTRRSATLVVGASFVTLSIAMSIYALYQNQKAESAVSEL